MNSDDLISAGEPTSDVVALNVDSLNLCRLDDAVEVTFGGRFEASLGASLVCNCPEGDAIEEFQGNSVVGGGFSVVAVCEIGAGPSYVEEGEFSVAIWNQDLSTAR